MDTFDLIILGAGPGGYIAAIHAAQNGLTVAVVEERPLLGGTCLNVGCIPSKALLEASGQYWQASQNYEKVKGAADFDSMQSRKDGLVQQLGEGVAYLLKKHKVAVFQGRGRVLSPSTVEVDGKTVEAKSILLATGSTPLSLPGVEIDEKTILSSTGALALPKVPKTMGVVGGGVIGVEIASIYQRIGCQVTVVEMLPHLCDPMDAEIRSHLLPILEKQGIQFHLSTKVDAIEAGSITFDGEKHTFDVILIAIGRKPNTEGLGLEDVGLSLTGKGFIPVNDAFQSAIPSIYAIGDLIEGPMLAHRASAEGVAFAQLVAGKTASVSLMTIPTIVYTDPEVASVGWTEEEAKKHGLELLVGRAPFKTNPRALCEEKTDGFVKVIGEKTSGRLVGMHILGPHASEMIHVGTILLQLKGTVGDLAVAPIGHPTLSEAMKEAAENALVLHSTI